MTFGGIFWLLLRCLAYEFFMDLPAKSEKTANANLLVNNLPSGTKAVDVRALVSQYGKVFSVILHF